MSQKKSVYDLAFDYINAFFSKYTITHEEKKAILMGFGMLITNGWTEEEIREHIRHKHKIYNSTTPALEMPIDVASLFSAIRPQTANLVTAAQFYYHNELRITTSAPIVDLDPNTGEITRVVEDYFLEMRASYTLTDLYQYFLSKDCLYEKSALNPTRTMGSLKWLTGQYNIDLLLFMFDTAQDIILTMNKPRLKTPMDAADYYTEATTAYQRRITESKISGDDRIVPRKRVLSH